MAVVGLLGVISGILSSRILGPKGRGELTALMLVPGLMAKIGHCGLTQAVAYLMVKGGTTERALGISSMTVAAIIGLVQALTLVPLLGVIAPLTTPLRPIGEVCLVWLPLNLLFMVVLGLDLGAGRFLAFNASQVVNSFVYVLLLILLTITGKASPAFFALAIIVASITALVFRWRVLVNQLQLPSVHTALEVLRRGWAYSQPELVGWALVRGDSLILARLVSSEELGQYTVALTVATAQLMAANPVAQVCFQSVSSSAEESVSMDLLARQFRLFQVIFMVLAVLVACVAPVAVPMVFGSLYIRSTKPMCLLILAMGVWSCSQLLEGGMRGLDRGNLCTWGNVVGLLVLVSLAQPIVHYFGITGMAGLVLLAQISSLAAKLALLQCNVGFSVSDFWGFNLHTFRDLKVISQRLTRREL